jgi:hypothetical protein
MATSTPINAVLVFESGVKAFAVIGLPTEVAANICSFLSNTANICSFLSNHHHQPSAYVTYVLSCYLGLGRPEYCFTQSTVIIQD